VAALYFDKLVLLDPLGASWDTIGADTCHREAVNSRKTMALYSSIHIG
jgi:hypothetical protein